mmetsp:Transcript_31862/g.53253  ORF Transcript_31862/g.53253 Transcript_31862/m.53253 type:complete len:296 (+) Transcript_31862:907-1794(+)
MPPLSYREADLDATLDAMHGGGGGVGGSTSESGAKEASPRAGRRNLMDANSGLLRSPLATTTTTTGGGGGGVVDSPARPQQPSQVPTLTEASSKKDLSDMPPLLATIDSGTGGSGRRGLDDASSTAAAAADAAAAVPGPGPGMTERARAPRADVHASNARLFERTTPRLQQQQEQLELSEPSTGTSSNAAAGTAATPRAQVLESRTARESALLEAALALPVSETGATLELLDQLLAPTSTNSNSNSSVAASASSSSAAAVAGGGGSSSSTGPSSSSGTAGAEGVRGGAAFGWGTP